MKRKLVFLTVVLVCIFQMQSYALTKTPLSAPVRIAIKKYKTGNYTGCLQDCQNIVERDPYNSLAYYYIAMSYVQAGKKDDAINYYAKVLSLTSDAMLKQYAETGKRCLETPDKCTLEPVSTTADASDLDRFINNTNKPFSDSVKQEIRKRNLEEVRNEINTDQDVNPYQFRKFKDFSNKHSQTETKDKISQNPPTNDEIVAALRTLKAAGLNPYSQPAAAIPNAETGISEANTQVSDCKNPDLMYLNMLTGENNQSKSNDAMLNMLPALVMQNKDGTSNYSPQLMQSVIMNSMMSNMNFNLDEDKGR